MVSGFWELRIGSIRWIVRSWCRRSGRISWEAAGWKLQIGDWKIQFRSWKRVAHKKTIPLRPGA